MKDYPKDFEAWWAKADDDARKLMACVGFCRAMEFLFHFFSLAPNAAKNQRQKKEEP